MAKKRRTKSKRRLPSNYLKHLSYIFLVSFIISLIITVSQGRLKEKTPTMFPLYPGPKCENDTKITVSTAIDATRIDVTALTPYSNVEIRVTMDGQETSYQGPSVSQNGDWIVWTWYVNQKLATVTGVKFYIDVPSLGNGGNLCGSWFSASSMPSGSPQSSISPSPLASPEASPSPSASAIVSPSPSASLERGIAKITIKFDGVPANENNNNLTKENYDKEIRIIWQKINGEEKEKRIALNYQAEEKVYQGKVNLNNLRISEGKYNILLKGPVHRQIRFCKEKDQSLNYICYRNEGILITTGRTLYDWDFTDHPLEFGDVDWDGQVGVKDYSLIKTCKAVNLSVGICRSADGNFDGVVDNSDIDLLYKTLFVKPDDE